jgi:hypothetical protein
VTRGLGVLIVFVAALVLVAGVQAGPKHARGLAGEQGAPAAQVAFERALGYFAPGQAQRRFVKAAKSDPRGATMALRDLAATFKSLSRADRRLARQILARPTDTGGGNYSAPKGNFRKSCTGTPFCVHWVTSTVDAPSPTDADVNGKPDWIDNVILVMNEVWNQEITTLGYRAPRADKPTGGHRGGNPNTKIDIFIQDVGRPSIGVYGYCTTDDPRRSVRRDVSAYCVLDDDYSASQFQAPSVNGLDALKVTASHEFHHASQFAYDWKEDRALMEATATNMEADVYPTIHDNFQYFVFSPLTNPNTQDDGPWWPIDMFDAQSGNQYGDWIFYRFLEEYIGSPTHPDPTRNPAINRVIWEKAAAIAGTNKGGKYSTQAIRSAITALGGNFDAAFAEFGWANASPANWYDEGELYPTAGFVDRGFFGPVGDSSDVVNWSMYHFSNDYVLFKPNASASSLEFNVDFPTTSRGPAATVLTLNQDGSVSHTAIPLATDGTGNLTGVTFDDALVDGVVLVLTNDSTRMEKCGKHSFAEQITFACRGNALDNFLNGQFHYAVTAS